MKHFVYSSFQSDLEGYQGDLLDLFDQVGDNSDLCLDLDTPEVTCPPEQATAPALSIQTDTCTTTTMTASQGPELDHKYCRSPLPSDSGISTERYSTESPISPALSDANSVLSPQSGGMSPSGLSRSDSISDSGDQSTGSPLGGGLEDLQLADMNFDAFADGNLDMRSDYEKLIKSIDTSDTALDIDGKLMMVGTALIDLLV